MEQKLTDLIYGYLVDNHPDLLVTLRNPKSIADFLSDKVENAMPLANQLTAGGYPEYLILEVCLSEMTHGLRPSKYNYIASVLQQDFQSRYDEWREAGILTYEIINLIEHSSSTFEEFQFSEDTEDDKWLRYAVTGDIQFYLEEPRRKPA